MEINAIKCGQDCQNVDYFCMEENLDMRPTRMWSDEKNWKDRALRKIPSESKYTTGEPNELHDVLIPCDYVIVLDKAEIRINSLTIDGTVRIDPSLEEVNIYVKYIWVREGELYLDDDSEPFPGKINIYLEGDSTTPELEVDN